MEGGGPRVPAQAWVSNAAYQRSYHATYRKQLELRLWLGLGSFWCGRQFEWWLSTNKRVEMLMSRLSSKLQSRHVVLEYKSCTRASAPVQSRKTQKFGRHVNFGGCTRVCHLLKLFWLLCHYFMGWIWQLPDAYWQPLQMESTDHTIPQVRIFRGQRVYIVVWKEKIE